jgi:preprotein translocase subunit SecF
MDLIKSAKKRKQYIAISLILVILSIVSILYFKLSFGIDFAGGTLLEIKTSNDISREKLSEKIQLVDFIDSPIVQSTDNNQFIIRTSHLEKNEIDILNSHISNEVGEYEQIRLEVVGPTISQDTTQKAIWAIILASLAIIIYIAYAFRQVPKPANSWKFGITAIITLIHDLLITIGIFAILGYLFNYEINSLFIVAMLTILGYSVNDTIIIFDRIRENLKLNLHQNSFAEIVNQSLIQSITRSLNTSITLILVLTTLLLLGGESIRSFISLLLIGTIIGTYSSMFLAPPLLTSWQLKHKNNIK